MKNPLKNKWQRKWLSLDVTHVKIQEMADAAQDFCARWMNNNPIPALLILVGDSGTAKTHTLKKILRFCSAAAHPAFDTGKWGSSKIPSVMYMNFPETASRLVKDDLSELPDIFMADLLGFDDLGAEDDQWKKCPDKICQILSRREKKFTVLTTNLSPQFWAGVVDEKLKKSVGYDVRIADRLLRNSTCVDLTGVPSYVMATK
jgi:DNA replication protein DnaC